MEGACVVLVGLPSKDGLVHRSDYLAELGFEHYGHLGV